MISSTGKTPQNTLASVIYCEMKRDPNCVFTKVGPMTFGLKDFNAAVVDDGFHPEPSVIPKGKAKTKRRKKKSED